MTAAGPRPLGFLPWLLASLALHALVLVQWPRSGAPRETVADTAGDLILQVQVLPPAAPARPASAPPAPATAATAREAQTESAQSRTAAGPRIVAAPARSAQPHNAQEHGMTVAADVLQPAAARGTVGNTAHGTAAAGGAADTDAAAAGWPELVALLHAAIDRHKRYPQSALSMGREGSTRVDFRLRPDGHIDDVNIGVSSGVRALDQAAFRAVLAIAPFTHAGRYLDGTQRFQVDVVFRLN